MIPPYFYCIVCDKPLAPCFFEPGDDDRNSSLDDGALFGFYGAYGTTLFDPSPTDPEERIEVAICDWCLQEKVERVRLYIQDGSTGSFAEHIKTARGPGPRPGKS